MWPGLSEPIKRRGLRHPGLRHTQRTGSGEVQPPGRRFGQVRSGGCRVVLLRFQDATKTKHHARHYVVGLGSCCTRLDSTAPCGRSGSGLAARLADGDVREPFAKSKSPSRLCLRAAIGSDRRPRRDDRATGSTISFRPAHCHATTARRNGKAAQLQQRDLVPPTFISTRVNA